MRIDTATNRDIHHVARHMRESDRKEFSALYPADSREDLADQLAARYGGRTDMIVAKIEDMPTAIGAVIEARPNVLTLMFLATDGFPKIALPLTRFITKRLFPPLIASGVHRLECISIVGHHAAHRWIEVLGLSLEAVCYGYGKNGEDFLQFSWVKDVRSSGA